MISLTVKPVDGGTNKYGKDISDLQDGITIEGDEISGTLKYTKDFVKAFGEDEKDGNFLALEISSDNGKTITTEVVNGTHGPVTVDDGFCIYRITDKDTQKIKITVSKGDQSKVVQYGLTGLTCDEAGEP